MIAFLNSNKAEYSVVILTPEESKYVLETVRNIIFDLREDDEDKWYASIDELRYVLDMFDGSEDATDEEKNQDN